MKEIVMKHKLAILAGLALAAIAALVVLGILYSQYQSSADLRAKVAALKDQRDSGTITQQDYEAKVNALQAEAAPSHGFNLSFSGTRKVEITDPNYQMTAYTLEIPSNWKFAGTIARNPGCHSTGPSLKYTAESPDGKSALVVMPGATWSWSSSPSMQKIMAHSPCPSVDIDTAAGFLLNIAVPNLRPDAKIYGRSSAGPRRNGSTGEST